jgi:hypothetical protein
MFTLIHPDSSFQLWRVISDEYCFDFAESTDIDSDKTYRTVLFDLKRWDQYWQIDVCNYVPSDLSQLPQKGCSFSNELALEVTMHQRKIDRWHNQLSQPYPKVTSKRIGGVVPAVCFDVHLTDHHLRIKQGRHRIAYLRSLQCPVFAAAIPIERLIEVENLALIYSPED